MRESDEALQSIEEHLNQVGELAAGYGEKMLVENLARLTGILHDLGKISAQFQKYIQAAHDNPENPPKRGSVDHSTLGGKILYKLYGKDTQDLFQVITIEIAANVIISHHGYLQDFITPNLESKFLKRVVDKKSPEIIEGYDLALKFLFENILTRKELDQLVDSAVTELKIFVEKLKEGAPPVKNEASIMFLTKAVFSTLIDADRTNTRQFEENDYSAEDYNVKELFSGYYNKLMQKVESFEKKVNANQIDLLRSDMSKQCDDFSEQPPGIYTLSIPTGGGKTLASFRYALKHAMIYNKKRILYVLPYTTIIEQNAEEIRTIIQDPAHILEHHSNVTQDENEEITEDEFDIKSKLQLVQDNWDVPIVFTTMVQFLNVFYENGTRSIRRFHNLADSVIIFDEVQKVPTHCISLFNEAVNFLKTHLNCTVLLCTATQPALDGVTHGLKLSNNHEIVKAIDDVAKSFKRVEIIDRATEGTMDTTELASFIIERSSQVNSQLIILNTKSVVMKLYQKIIENAPELNIYHLSTTMTPSHRKETLGKMRKELNEGIPVICVSTQLIEAGVDISFESVIRSVAGIDSIAQAAGRCNRNGERSVGEVYVIDHTEEKTEKLIDIDTGKSITRKLLSSMSKDPELYDGDLLSRKAMTYYFDSFYAERQDSLDHPHAKIRQTQVELLMSSRKENKLVTEYMLKNKTAFPVVNSSSMNTAAKAFNVIENRTTSVIVQYGGGKDIVADLNSDISISDLYDVLKRAQQFTIEVYENELASLKREGGVYQVLSDEVYVLEQGFYDSNIGLNLKGDSLFTGLFS